MDFGFISTLLFGMCSYLSAPLVLVICCNPSIRKHVFGKFEGIKFDTCSTCFVDLVPSLVFSEIFLDVWCHSGVHFALFFRKKQFRKSLQKKTLPQTQISDIRDYAPARRLPDSPPRVRTSRTRNNSSSSKCCSNSCPCLWFRKIDRKWLFELASIANVSKTNRKNEKGRCIIERASPPVIWHALGRGPANSKKSNYNRKRH